MRTFKAKRMLAIVCIVAMLAGMMLPSYAAEGAADASAKLAQTISMSSFGTKVYGDEPFKVAVTPDPVSKLTDFMYVSSDTDVAEVAADGTVTIKAAGETDIIAMQLGSDAYFPTACTQRLVVEKREVSITELDLDSRIATLDGVLAEDEGKVALDFDKVMLEEKTEETEPSLDEVYESLGYVKIRGVICETPLTAIGYEKVIDTSRAEEVTIDVIDDYDTDNKAFLSRADNDFLVNGTNAADYLGYSVIAYLEANDLGQFEIVSIELDPLRNQVLTIGTNQYVGYTDSGSKIEYLEEGATTTTKIEIDVDMQMVYNFDGGFAYSLDDVINGLYGGSITFVDNDDVIGYNVAIVEQAATAVVDEAVDNYVAFKETASLAVGGDIDELYIDESDETRVTKFFKDGEEISYSELTEWDVLSIYAASYDSDVIIAEVITNQIIGLIDSTKASKTSADRVAYYINDVWYDISASCSGDLLKIGLGGTFYIDNGKIVAFNEDTALAGGIAAEYGYILNIAVDDDVTFSSAVAKVQMLTVDGVQIFELNNNARVDDVVIYTSGSTCVEADTHTGHKCAYEAINNIPINTVVQYAQNAENKIVMIKTAGYNDDFNGTMFEGSVHAEYEAENRRLDGAGYIDADAKVFAIDPTDAKASKVLTIDAFEDKNEYTVLGMFATDEAEDNDIVVVDIAAFMTAGATSNIAVITGISETTNEMGENVWGLSYYINGEEVENITNVEVAETLMPTIGDVVKLKVMDDVITSIESVYNFTEDIRNYDGTMDTVTSGSYVAAVEEVFAAGVATAYKKSSSQITLPSGNTFKLISDANVYVIDFTVAGDVVVGTEGSYDYFENVYESYVDGELFTAEKNGSVIAEAVTAAGAIALTDYVVVREYDGRVTDYVVIKGVDSITSLNGSEDDGEVEEEETVDENAEYGFILDTAVDDSGSFAGADIKVQMLTDDGVQAFAINNNAKLDDMVAYKSGMCCYDDGGTIVHDGACGNTCAYSAIEQIPLNTIVKYIKNDEGNIVSITTASYDFDGEMFDYSVIAEYEAENLKLDGAGYIDADAKVFAIDPTDAKASKVLTIDAFEDKNEYTVLGMFATDKAEDNDIVVVDIAAFMTAGATSNIAVITEVAETLNDNYEEVLWLTYLKDGQEYSHHTSADVASVTMPTPGDVVKLKVMDDVITSIKFVYNFTEDIRNYDGTMDSVVMGNYYPGTDEVFDAGIATAYKKSSSQILFGSGNIFKLVDDANKYIIDFTVTGDVVVGTTGSYKYFSKIYEDAVDGEVFTVKKDGCVIATAVTAAGAIALTDYVVVREYDGRVTDYVIIKGADTIIKTGEFGTVLEESESETSMSSIAIITPSSSGEDEGEEVYHITYEVNDEEVVVLANSVEQQAAITELLNAGDVASFTDIFVDKLSVLGCEDIVAGYSDADLQSIGQILYDIRLAELDETSTCEDWLDAIKTAAVIVDLNNSYTANIFDKLDSFGTIKDSGEKVAEFYGKEYVTDSFKTEVTERLLDRGITNKEEFFKLFAEAFVCTAVHQPGTWSDVREILYAFSTESDIDISQATDKVYKMLAGVCCDNYAALKAAFDSAVSTMTPIASGGGGGGGGTSSSGAIVQVSAYNLCLKGEKAENYVIAETRIDDLSIYENNIVTLKVYLTGAVSDFRGCGNGNYLAGSMLTVAVTPVSGRVLEGWYINDERVSTDLDYTFCIEEDTEIYAYFAEDLTVSTETVYTEEDGKWKFTSTVTNCPANATLVVALYSGDTMVGMKATDISSATSVDSYIEKCSFDDAKVMLWESADSLKPLAECEKVPVQ